jgi:hypothetical protein
MCRRWTPRTPRCGCALVPPGGEAKGATGVTDDGGAVGS